ncbi:putative gpi anchored protein [Rosellinia necatrix]|uniref:Putative gpi anchored protein n=1 Tax=Rosellinia necatrix TaxID=77044 RepID=A0A1W2TIK8_ROSNE|nr:putative gpi anchored protein [Rosellinia necatrix]
MKSAGLALLAAIGSSFTVAKGSEVHGEGVEGTVQGPVAFLWPENRPWSAATDNVGPCGSPSGASNRTDFPLSQGSVALTIADEAWNVAFSIAYADDPTIQSQFAQQVVSVPEVESGHQCYKIADIPNNVAAGSNATIQLEYWSNIDNELEGRNQTFFACADITFVEAADFTVQVPCFNVTSGGFHSPETSSTPTTGGQNDDASQSSLGGGLGKGAIAGIAVGVIVASLLVIGVAAFVVFRRRSNKSTDHENELPRTKGMAEATSIGSGR